MSSHTFHGFWHLYVVLPINGSSMLIFSCQVLLASTLNFWWFFILAEKTVSSVIRTSISKGKRDTGVFNTYIYRSDRPAVKKCLCQLDRWCKSLNHQRSPQRMYDSWQPEIWSYFSSALLPWFTLVLINWHRMTNCYQADWYGKQGLKMHKMQR